MGTVNVTDMQKYNSVWPIINRWPFRHYNRLVHCHFHCHLLQMLRKVYKEFVVAR